jgi:hypothetical protein
MKRECVAAEVSVAIEPKIDLKRSLRPLLGSNFRSNFGRKWHIASLRGDAAIQSLSEPSGHAPSLLQNRIDEFTA